MRKFAAICLVLVASALVAACNQATSSTPVAPQSSATVSMGEQRSNSSPVTLCHSSPDSDPAWVVITVDNGSVKYKGHLRHGDYTTSSCSTLSSLHPADDCTCCLTNTCGGI